MSHSVLAKMGTRYRIFRRNLRRVLRLSRPHDPQEGKTTLNILRTLYPFIPFCGGAYSLRADATLRGMLLMFPVLEMIWKKVFASSVPVLTLDQFVESLGGLPNAPWSFDLVFGKHGSDKAHVDRNYGGAYRAIVSSIGVVRTIAEVGIGSGDPLVLSNMGDGAKPGASLRAWRECIPGVRLIGADIDRSVLFKEEGIVTCFVDQLNADSFGELRELCSGGVELLIDDGLHSVASGLTTLSFWLEIARGGDWFVVEDVHELQVPVWRAVCTSLSLTMDTWVIATSATAFLVAFRRR